MILCRVRIILLRSDLPTNEIIQVAQLIYINICYIRTTAPQEYFREWNLVVLTTDNGSYLSLGIYQRIHLFLVAEVDRKGT